MSLRYSPFALLLSNYQTFNHCFSIYIDFQYLFHKHTFLSLSGYFPILNTPSLRFPVCLDSFCFTFCFSITFTGSGCFYAAFKNQQLKTLPYTFSVSSQETETKKTGMGKH